MGEEEEDEWNGLSFSPSSTSLITTDRVLHKSNYRYASRTTLIRIEQRIAGPNWFLLGPSSYPIGDLRFPVLATYI